MLKSSDVTLPKDLPENEGALLFLWRKGHSENNPSMTWDKLDDDKFGEAFQILATHLLELDFRNLVVANDMLLFLANKMYPEKFAALIASANKVKEN
jgi:hypothetical protein